MPDPTPPPALLENAAFVRRLAWHLLRDDAAADDAAQETLARAIEHPPDSRAGGIRPWLAQVLRNVVRRGHRADDRRTRREFAAARAGSAPAADDLASRAELVQLVGQAVRELDVPLREVVLLRHYEGLPPREIAARLAIPVETVRSRLRRAYEHLRARLDEGGRGNVEGWRSALAGFVGWDGVRGGVTPAVGGLAMASAINVGIGVAAAAAVVAIGAWWFTAQSPGPTPGLSPPGVAGEKAPPEIAAASGLAPRGAERATPPVAAAPTLPAAQPTAADIVALSVLDVADGTPVAGLRVRIAPGDEAAGLELEADLKGTIAVAWQELAGTPEDPRPRHVTVVTPGWKSTLREGPAVLSKHAIPVFRILRVRGHVREEAAGRARSDLTAVQLMAMALAEPEAAGVPPGPGPRHPSPGSAAWLALHGLGTIDLGGARVGEDGSFDVELPRLPRLAMWAAIAGRSSVQVEVGAAAGAGEAAPVVLVLRPAPVVAGLLRLGTGAPVAGARVEVHLVRRFEGPPTNVRPGDLVSAQPGGKSRVHSVLAVTTDANGRFSFPLPAAGTVTLFTHPDGCQPGWKRLGLIDADRELELVAFATPGATATFVCEGVPFVGRLVFSDVTDADVQVRFGEVETDEEGRVTASWLVPGQAFHVKVLQGPESGYFRWSGPGTAPVDLAHLVGYEQVRAPK